MLQMKCISAVLARLGPSATLAAFLLAAFSETQVLELLWAQRRTTWPPACALAENECIPCVCLACSRDMECSRVWQSCGEHG